MTRTCLFLLGLVVTSAFGVELGDRAPNIIGKFLGGERNGEWFRLNRAPAQPTLINFFWVDCLPCAEELPELAQLERQFPRVRFLAVHAEDDDAEAISQYLAKLPAHPRNILQGSSRLQKVYAESGYDFLPLPYTVLVNSQGSLTYRSTGYNAATIQRLTAALKQLAEND